MPTETDLAYAAGYFDGEGTVTIRKTGSTYSMTARIGNTYKPALDWLHDMFGGPVYVHSQATDTRRRVWVWYLMGKTAYDFLIKIRPYLKEKGPQADEAIEFYALYGGAGRGSIGVVRPVRTTEQKADQEKRRLRVAALKKVVYVT